MLENLLANFATAWTSWLPLGYSFGAGMVTTVNPCGFAMLPAYLGLYLGLQEAAHGRSSPLGRAIRALGIGLLVTLGFVLLFAGVGTAFGLAGELIISAMPWAASLIGFALIGLGLWTLTGRSLSIGFFDRLAVRVGTPGHVGIPSFVLFGIGYGVASLSCTLPIFLVVVGSALAAGGFLAGVGQFLSYSLGMGLVLIILTLGMALFKGTVLAALRGARAHIQPFSGVFLVVAGSYIVYYWLTKGQLLASVF